MCCSFIAYSLKTVKYLQIGHSQRSCYNIIGGSMEATAQKNKFMDYYLKFWASFMAIALELIQKPYAMAFSKNRRVLTLPFYTYNERLTESEKIKIIFTYYSSWSSCNLRMILFILMIYDESLGCLLFFSINLIYRGYINKSNFI